MIICIKVLKRIKRYDISSKLNKNKMINDSDLFSYQFHILIKNEESSTENSILLPSNYENIVEIKIINRKKRIFPKQDAFV